MPDINDTSWDGYRNWIRKHHERGHSYGDIRTASWRAGGLDAFLLDLADSGNPELGQTPAERAAAWEQIVSAYEEWEKREAAVGPVSVSREDGRTVLVPGGKGTLWHGYREGLLRTSFSNEAVRSIESAALNILERLNRGQARRKPVKGMAVGHVQSGKTANMAGLMAMAFDQGINLVIVLSGTIESLRKQTMNRLAKDLQSINGNLAVSPIPKPSLDPDVSINNCNFTDGAAHRYFSVVLKNINRLNALKAWLQPATPAQRDRIKVLIIDDEADQAGIDTFAPDDPARTAINQAIIDLVRSDVRAMNYVAYTATPYANLLNESPDDESLYPRDFIFALPQSNEHFGPMQVFGIDQEMRSEPGPRGLGVAITVPSGDMSFIEAIHHGVSEELPQSLKDAICWFLCGVACVRQGQVSHEPFTMLVHTSPNQKDHDHIASAIARFIEDNSQAGTLTGMCQKVWQERSPDLTHDTFRERFPSYGRMDRVQALPQFAQFEAQLKSLFSVSHIKMNENREPQFNDGTHLCIDNCAFNGVNDDGEHVRLIYPDPGAGGGEVLAKAFIVVGGNTLSRGLTLSNLISTYFVRTGFQMDTLMQMGRWFGYRRGYELLPRIWMLEAMIKKFREMAVIEDDLREELRRMSEEGIRPEHYGPRVRMHPSFSKLRPTARNRMQAAAVVHVSFADRNRQTQKFFRRDTQKLQRNRAAAAELFAACGEPTAPLRAPHAALWRGVPAEYVANFIESLVFVPGTALHDEQAALVDWVRKNARTTQWNVIVPGMSQAAQPTWPVGSRSIARISRSPTSDASSDEFVAVGAVRDKGHLLLDAPDTWQAPAIPSDRGAADNAWFAHRRREAGLAGVAQLALYCVQGEGEAEETGYLGISLWIPRALSGDEQYTAVAVKIPNAQAGGAGAAGSSAP